MAAANQSGSNSPNRPPNIRDIELAFNGSPTFLGVITTTTTAQDNNGTSVAFFNSATQQQNGGQGNFAGTLAGKMLLLLPDAACHVMGAATPIGTPGQTSVATFSPVQPAAGTVPGVKIQAQERLPFMMQSTQGYLQMIPSTGTVNMWVWELS